MVNQLLEHPSQTSALDVENFFRTAAAKQETFEIFSTERPEIERIPNQSSKIIYLHHKINDLPDINAHLRLLNAKLQLNGLLVCNCETLVQRKERIRRKFGVFAVIFTPIDFAYKRILPKLTHLNKVYQELSHGKNRAISRAEILGRLLFCGYQIIKMEDVDNLTHLIVKKVKLPATGPEPDCGFFYHKRSYGQHGAIVNVIKFRTMHPYSEYVRDYVLNHNGYKHHGNGAGKIEGDFRVTSWGRFFRKYWIDELPQLINLFKGQLKLVGVRPLGNSLYAALPSDLQRARFQYKSGIIPPYYVDLPQTIDDVFESERRYLELYEKHPLTTDFKYFWRAMGNILLKNARSD